MRPITSLKNIFFTKEYFVHSICTQMAEFVLQPNNIGTRTQLRVKIHSALTNCFYHKIICDEKNNVNERESMNIYVEFQPTIISPVYKYEIGLMLKPWQISVSDLFSEAQYLKFHSDARFKIEEITHGRLEERSMEAS